MADTDEKTPKPNNRAVKPSLVKVRVIGKQPINEGGQHYAPKSKGLVKGVMTEFPAAIFETTAERAEALGEHVEIVTE